MKFILISGMSGAGKSTVLHSLEDCDYYCVDNLPIIFLNNFVEKCISGTDTDSIYYNRDIAVSISAEKSELTQPDLSSIISMLKKNHIEVRTLFINANETVLLQRYNETRRPHPMAAFEKNKTLAQYIAQEREILNDFASVADSSIDTSNMVPIELRNRVQKELCEKNFFASLLIQSFGYKKGLPSNSDYIFDARYLKNPYWNTTLRSYSGTDSRIIQFLEQDKNSKGLVTSICSFLAENLTKFNATNRSYVTVSIGCTGGHHRSVYVVENIYAHLSEQPYMKDWVISKYHRDLL